ncbi:DMT family transporter [Alkalihalophilus marmarensis]|uniref:DMT family transporter n=1 Tax=Alkalihalophilus marmarensis TaxID=521377 RepID=UPI002DBF855C|nr:multidrug resistance efflux transporter family protein [Alkalihalophilus marmarensis]MEC2070425.1 multidrug resistance efflux transporter family protein [Alkalihalophilus marmarensis]
MKAILIGLLASVFFSLTFILNRSMELEGGSWYWSASLRFFFMVPFLLLIVWLRGGLADLFKEMKKHPSEWFIWSFFGFVVFYAPITYAAGFGPGWLIAGTWQTTIVAGLLLAPLFYETIRTTDGFVRKRQKILLHSLWPSVIILAGVFFVQFEQSSGVSALILLGSVIPVVIAAFAYPLGNRKMLELVDGSIDTFQRVLGMTLMSLPWWVLLAGYGFIAEGLPSQSQVTQSFIVALSSGIIATVLFFFATNLVRHEPQKLAAVEATQSGSVVFAFLGELLLLGGAFPSIVGLFGLLTVVTGMIIHSFHSRGEPKHTKTASAKSV